MRTVQVAEFKARFSEIIDAVRAGETIVVAYGRNHDKVAALIPFDQLPARPARRLGLLAGQARATFAEDFSISDDELLGP